MEVIVEKKSILSAENRSPGITYRIWLRHSVQEALRDMMSHHLLRLVSVLMGELRNGAAVISVMWMRRMDMDIIQSITSVTFITHCKAPSLLSPVLTSRS
jgi:hypothetical protein